MVADSPCSPNPPGERRQGNAERGRVDRLADRLCDTEAAHTVILGKLEEGQDTMRQHGAAIEANAGAITELRSDLQPVIEVSQDVGGAVRVLRRLGAGAVWVGKVTAAGSIVIASLVAAGQAFGWWM